MIANYTNDLRADTHLALLTAIAETMSESVMITEADLVTANPKIVYVNPSFTKLTGYQREEVVGQTPKLLQGGKTEREVLERLKVDLHNRHAWKGRTYNYMKSGQPFLMEWEIVPIHDTAGDLRFYLTIQRRVDEVEPTRDRLEAIRRWSSACV